jgi:serine/threonine protein kinase
MVTNQLLGSGGHGDVFVAIHKKSDRQLACKIVNMLSYTSDTPERKPFQDVTNTRDGSPIQRQRVQRDRDNILNSPQFREFDILKDLDHANIVHLEKVFWSSSTIFIFQELVTGGDLFSYIEYNGGKLSDADSALILLQILKGVEYMHDRDIVHRDLKPDNILVSTSTDTPLRVVITDFGSCRRVETPKSRVIEQQAAKRRMFTIVGTLEYAAPFVVSFPQHFLCMLTRNREIYDKGTKVPSKRGYSKAIDMWSIGAVATALLTGDVIFTDRLNPVMRKDPAKVILDLSSKCDLSILDNGYSAWRAVGKRPKDFVRKLLVVDESKRLDIKQALAHDWFTNKYCEDSFKAVYEKAISAWQPRRISFRVVEALDLHRLKHSPTKKDNDDPGHSRFFRPLPVPFPQGEMYARNIASPTNTAHGMLPTIGEEVTPEPETPGHGSPEVPIAPKGKKLGRAATSFDVQYSLSQLDLAAGVPATSASTDITMTDHEQQNESESLDLDAPVANTKRLRSASLLTPVHELLEVENDDDVDEAVQETPPMQRKRPREADPDKDETCDSSLELIAERSIQMAAANVTKKMKARW